MISHFRVASKSIVLPNLEAFWRYVDDTERRGGTHDSVADAEERLDLRAGQAIKAVLETVIGPEEGSDPVQMQNWDWNDDRTRPVFILRAAFKPEILSAIRQLLTGDLATFRVLVLLQDDWESETWGGVVLTGDTIAVQQSVLSAFVVA